MTTMKIISNILMMFAGLGVFMIGMREMGDNLEIVAGNKLRKVFNRISNNRIVGMGIGAGVTAVIQSSSATTVMVVGFVNAGVMTLTQATSIIMGANIGTTITAQIIQLKTLNLTIWFAAMACIGAFMGMSKKDGIKKVGAILAGLGMIFVGLEFMSLALKPFAELQGVQNFFAKTTNPALLLLLGLAFTALIQSSSATTGILITLAGTKLIGIQQSIFVLLGVNIGTCITAILASIGTNANAKRASAIHLLFNVAGALLFLPFCLVLPIGTWLESAFDAPETQIAMFHTVFNVITTLILLPFTNYIVKFATLIIPEKKVAGGVAVGGINNLFTPQKLKFIDDRILQTPAIAMTQIKKEVLLMSEIAKLNLDTALNSITTLSMTEKDIFNTREKQINFMNRNIGSFLVKASAQDISFKDEIIIGTYYHVVSDIERIGDYAENIIEYTENMIKDGTTFSAEAIDEISALYKNIEIIFENSMRAFENADLSLLNVISKYEDIVDESKRMLGYKHIERLHNNICTAESGAMFLSLISNLERIADHMTNIAVSIKDYAKIPVKVSAAAKPPTKSKATLVGEIREKSETSATGNDKKTSTPALKSSINPTDKSKNKDNNS